MQTISVLNRKGGVGKSTIATNLARAFQRRGDEVVLIDTDPQGSTSDFCETAIENDHPCPPTFTVDRPTVHEQMPQLNGYDVAIIDGVAKVSEMDVSSIKASDLVLIPVRPSAVDVWAVGEIVDLVQARREVTDGPEAALVSSHAPARPSWAPRRRRVRRSHGFRAPGVGRHVPTCGVCSSHGRGPERTGPARRGQGSSGDRATH
jgi:chromosome partitioning protein